MPTLQYRHNLWIVYPKNITATLAQPEESSAPTTLNILNCTNLVEMKPAILTRIINSAIWIVSGIVVIIVRVSVTQGGAVLLWETIGGGMVAYGALRLVWALFRPSSTSATSI